MSVQHQHANVAAIQMCSSDVIDENLRVAQQLILQAADDGANLIVLPENFALMASINTASSKYKETEGQGKIQAFLSQAAHTAKAWLVGGTIPLASQTSHKVRAACLVYSPSGKLVARYDKSHLFNATLSLHESYNEAENIEAGDQLVVVATPFGKVGLAVCFDVRFPDQFQALARLGAEIMVLPSAFTVPTGAAHWEVLVRSRAMDTFAFMIAAAQGGRHANGRTTYGHSMIVGPWGNVLAEKDAITPGPIFANIDLADVYRTRQSIPLNGID